MLRRSHKKSRGGCQECKRRHVKCDENRPICRLCGLSERTCSFALEAEQNKAAGLTARSPTRDTLSTQPHGSIVAGIHNATPLTPISRHVSPQRLPVDHPCNDKAEAPINFEHMELLIHITQNTDIFNSSTTDESHQLTGLAVSLKEALKAPYLMYELLAFSAQHLAFLHPEKSMRYLHQAISLQTRAISLFNATRTEISKSNCVHVILFSSVLGHQLLADTLQSPQFRGLNDFVAHFVQCAETHRGVYIIARSVWPLLLDSELGPILSKSAEFTARKPVGTECQSVKDLIEDALGLTKEDKEGCHQAIRYLQVGFDAVAATDGAFVNRHLMIYVWTMLIPSSMTRLLAKQQPEAL